MLSYIFYLLMYSSLSLSLSLFVLFLMENNENSQRKMVKITEAKKRIPFQINGITFYLKLNRKLRIRHL